MACVVRRLLRWLLALTIAFAVLVYVSSLLLHVPRPFREPVQNVLDGGAKREGAPVDPTKFRNQNRRERTELRDLSILMQKRINYLQNPANCTSAKKLACSFHRNRCGFGCLMHQVAFCFVLAYATERTLVIDSGGWRYSSEGWEGAFLPVSNCTIASNSVKGEYNQERMSTAKRCEGASNSRVLYGDMFWTLTRPAHYHKWRPTR